jgi:hypothetical protein
MWTLSGCCLRLTTSCAVCLRLRIALAFCSKACCKSKPYSVSVFMACFTHTTFSPGWTYSSRGLFLCKFEPFSARNASSNRKESYISLSGYRRRYVADFSKHKSFVGRKRKYRTDPGCVSWFYINLVL